MVEMLAWFGAALSCLLSLPQALRVLRAERLDGISAASYWIVLINAAVWAALGAAHRRLCSGSTGADQRPGRHPHPAPAGDRTSQAPQ